MKNTLKCIFLFVGISFNSAVYSQNQLVTIDAKGVKLEDVLLRIEQQTKLKFIFNKKNIDIDRRTNVSVSNKPVEAILKQIFDGTGISYVFKDNQVVLKVVTDKSVTTSKIKGTVSDSAGEPIIGANVVVKGSSVGTITDVDGKFALEAPSNATLIFSYVGFDTQEEAVKGKTSFNIVLVDNQKLIEEVVVIGYGTVKKRDLTGAVSNVSSGVLMNQAKMNDPLQALQGQIAGADITSGNAPGANSSIVIRGLNSLSASNAPLIIVDDAPFGGRLDEINPSEIEKIDVLKDASSTAIYGSRGSNGVVIITTKRGNKDGKINVEYDGYYGIGKNFQNFDMMNGEEYAQYRRDAYMGVSGSTVFDEVQNRVIESGEYLDWQKLMFDGTSNKTSHSLTLNTSTGRSRNFISLGYNKDQGIIDNMAYERFSGRLNSDIDLSKTVTVGYSALITHSRRDVGDYSVWRFGTRMDPLSELYDEDGQMNFYTNGFMKSFVHSNPLFDTQRDNVDVKVLRNRFLGNLNANWMIIDGLKFRTSLTYDFTAEESGAYFSKTSSNRQNSFNGASFNNTTESLLTFTNLFNYNKKIAADHNLDVSLVQDLQKYNWARVGASGFDIPYYGSWYNVNEAQLDISNTSGKSEWSLLSFMGRINYQFKDRYLFTLTGRYDGSSRLAAGNKWDFFPSAAFAWRMNEEAFLRRFDKLSNLKLRISYGTTGNTAIAPYATQGQFGRYPYSFGTNEISGIGYVPLVISNPDLGWEKTRELNIGVDFGFFNNRLSGSVDVYQRDTYDLLMQRKLPASSGYTSVWQNVGQTRNKGVELSIQAVPVKTKDFIWNTSFNVSYNKNEIVKLFNGEEDSPGNLWFIGQPISVEYLYKYNGVWQSDEADQAKRYSAIPGNGKYEDVNDNGKYDSEDLFIYNKLPKWILGFSTSFKYKNFDLGVYMYGRFGYKARLGVLTYQFGSTRFNQLKGNYWTPDNPTNDQPKPNDVADGYLMGSSFACRDLSFLRIKNINLGYTLPKNVSRIVKSDNIRIYVATENPAIFTKKEYVGLDPENANSEADPRPLTTFMIGLNAKF